MSWVPYVATFGPLVFMLLFSRPLEDEEEKGLRGKGHSPKRYRVRGTL